MTCEDLSHRARALRGKTIDEALVEGFDGWVELSRPEVVVDGFDVWVELTSRCHRGAARPTPTFEASELVRVGPWGRA